MIHVPLYQYQPKPKEVLEGLERLVYKPSQYGKESYKNYCRIYKLLCNNVFIKPKTHSKTYECNWQASRHSCLHESLL